MPLPQLNWKKLPRFDLQLNGSGSSVVGLLNAIYTLFSTSSYYDGSSRIAGSNSAWTFTPAISGTTTVAVFGKPPLTTEMSQSVIFAGSFTYTGSVYPKLFGFQFPTSLAAQADITNSLLIGNAINAGNYINWTSQSVFTSGSNMPLNTSSSFSGFYALTRNISVVTSSLNLKYLYAWEGQEAIAIQLSFTSSASAVNNGGTVGALAGALIDPDSNNLYDAHSDGRLYGLITTGTVTASTDFHLVTSSLFYNAGVGGAAVNSYQKYWSTFFKPNGFNYLSSSFPRPPYDGYNFVSSSATMSIWSITRIDNSIVDTGLSSSSGQTPVFPIYTKYDNAVNSALYGLTIIHTNTNDNSITQKYNSGFYTGILREIKMIRNLPSGLTYRSASVDIGHIFGSKDSGSSFIGNSLILMA